LTAMVILTYLTLSSSLTPMAQRQETLTTMPSVISTMMVILIFLTLSASLMAMEPDNGKELVKAFDNTTTKAS